MYRPEIILYCNIFHLCFAEVESFCLDYRLANRVEIPPLSQTCLCQPGSGHHLTDKLLHDHILLNSYERMEIQITIIDLTDVFKMKTFGLNLRSMKNIVSRKLIREFWEKYPDSEETLKTWYKVTMKADWKNSNEVKAQYKNASVVGDNRIVFNICRNKYRLIVKFNYEMQWGWIRFIGTHTEYDSINTLTI